MNKAADGSCKALQQLGNQSSTSGEHNWGFNCDMFYSPLCLDAEITTWICFLCACAAGQTQNDFENKQRTISFSIKLKIRDGAVMLLLLKYLQKVTAFCLGSTKIRLETLMGWGIVKKKKSPLEGSCETLELWIWTLRAHVHDAHLEEPKCTEILFKKKSLNLDLWKVFWFVPLGELLNVLSRTRCWEYLVIQWTHEEPFKNSLFF